MEMKRYLVNLINQFVFVDGRYRVSLPWKPGMREVLQNNKTVARKRFEGLVRRFKCDHELF
ncbi:integrase catalytic domain-containing protein, partial [Trichonephila clavata]